MKKYIPALCALLLLLVAYLYYEFWNELLLLLIPLLSFFSLKVGGAVFKRYLTGLFLLFFAAASLSLYLGSLYYALFGILSYTFLASIVIIVVAEYAGEKNDR